MRRPTAAVRLPRPLWGEVVRLAPSTDQGGMVGLLARVVEDGLDRLEMLLGPAATRPDAPLTSANAASPDQNDGVAETPAIKPNSDAILP